MIKRIVALLLALVFSVSVLSCTKTDRPETDTTAAQKETTAAPETTSTPAETTTATKTTAAPETTVAPETRSAPVESTAAPEPEKPIVTPPDKLARSRRPSGFEYTYFATSDGESAIRLRIPKDLELLLNGDGSYVVSKNRTKVGRLTSGIPATESGTILTKADSVTKENTTTEVFYGTVTKDGESVPCYRFVYTYTDKNASSVLCLEIEESEMDSYAYDWLGDARDYAIYAPLTPLPTLPVSANKRKQNVFVLGNSFVGTSEVGTILWEMVEQSDKRLGLWWQSIGNMTIRKLVGEYPERLNDIKNGKYDILFLCGIYNGEDVSKLSEIIKMCKASDTLIVLFPAHNEDSAQIEVAMKKYGNDVYMINWKEMLDAYISNGVDRWDLCVDDTYDHSRPLAGYVGAKMIFETLFGESPAPIKTVDSLTQSYVDSKLNRHTPSRVNLIDESEITRVR